MKYVLFVCTHNAGRSQIAQALFEALRARRLPRRVGRGGAGNRDLAERDRGDARDRDRHRRPPTEEARSRDAATRRLGDHAALQGRLPLRRRRVEDWDVDDPAEQPLAEVRRVRDELDERVREFVETRLDRVRADRTAHQIRLARLLPALAEEFEATKSPEEIRACADAILADYDEAPVRSFILTLAHRRTRECLREETCAVLNA
jgi:protein-tyrosine-phosphatase